MAKTLAIIGQSSSEKISAPKAEFRGRVAFVTLGCAKNQVDSEVMLGALEANGFEAVDNVAQADVAVVNTCGFLESSTKESLDNILELCEAKQSGRLRKVLVAGCLVGRYGDELRKSLPEVDAFLGMDDLLKVGAAISGEFKSVLDDAARPYFLYDDTLPRRISGTKHSVYIKVSEGCNRPCTFCIIPKIRGSMRSREIASVLREAENLAAAGVREINLVAQDMTSFGKDTGENLRDLLRKLNSIDQLAWIRLLYAYPIGVDTELLRAIKDLPKVCEYLDIPLQHSSEPVLKAMQRPIGRYAPRALVDFIKSTEPAIHLRTTFIVGFPGETENDIQELESFVAEGHFTNVGVFTYSREQGTPSYDLADQVPEREKESRRARIMAAQKKVLSRKLREFKGQELEVIIDGPHPDTDLLLSARTRFQAPEVDGTVIINESDIDPVDIRAGSMARVEISSRAGYDLIGRLLHISHD